MTLPHIYLLLIFPAHSTLPLFSLHLLKWLWSQKKPSNDAKLHIAKLDETPLIFLIHIQPLNGAHEGHPFFTTPLLHISHLMIHHFLLLHFLKWLWPQRMPSNHHSSKSTSNHRIFSNNNNSCNHDNNTNCNFITEAKKHLEGGPLDDEHREAITCKKSTTC